MDTELLPCPFCGGEAHAIAIPDFRKLDDFIYRVGCEGCKFGKVVDFSSEEEAVRTWNTRHLVNPHLSRYEPIAGTFVPNAVENV